MIRKRLWAVGLALAFLLAPYAGAQEPIVLDMMWWVPDVDDAGTRNERSIIQLFEERHPHIRVNLISADWGQIIDQIIVAVAANQPLDVVWIREDALVTFAELGVLLDLGPFIERDPAFDPRNLLPGVLESAQVQGVQYALHRDVWAPTIFYNVDRFYEAGIADPQLGWTFDDVIEIARRLTDPEANRFGIGNVQDNRNATIASYGGSVMNEEQTAFTLNAPEALSAIRYMHAAPWVHHVQPQPGDLDDWHLPQFQRGEIAMHYWGPWQWAINHDELLFTWDVAPPPAGPAGTFTTMDGLMIGISATTRNPEAAWELVKFLTYSEEAQTRQVLIGLASPTVNYPRTLQAFFESPSAPRTVQNYIDAITRGTLGVPRLPRDVVALIDEAFASIMADEGDIASIIEDTQRRAAAMLRR